MFLLLVEKNTDEKMKMVIACKILMMLPDCEVQLYFILAIIHKFENNSFEVLSDKLLKPTPICGLYKTLIYEIYRLIFSHVYTQQSIFERSPTSSRFHFVQIRYMNMHGTQ